MLNKFIITVRAFLIRLSSLSKGSRISLGASLYVHRGARLHIGRKVRIGKDCVISLLPGGFLTIGDGCIINRGSYIYVKNRVEIGPNTRVAHYCSIVDHDYEFRKNMGLSDVPKISASIIIGSNVWLGAYVMVLKGVRIGDRAVVGAKALVSKSLPANSIAYCRYCSELVIKSIDAS